MDYKNWEGTYKKILKDFNFSQKEDEKSAKVLDKLLQTKKNLFSINQLKDLINEREIVVFGAGPTLKSSIAKHKNLFQEMIKITADGATTALLENDILPDIIVTDLDGRISDQIKATLQGSIAIIHAHGDNIDNIKEYVPKFKGKIIGTTQTNPDQYINLYNFGGFTDGDRAVYLAYEFNAKKINLIGFDYDNIIGEYSFPKNKDKKQKIKKLEWCKQLINKIDEKDIITYL
jgi:uncharacterized Rossmann fold enzyme